MKTMSLETARKTNAGKRYVLVAHCSRRGCGWEYVTNSTSTGTVWKVISKMFHNVFIHRGCAYLRYEWR